MVKDPKTLVAELRSLVGKRESRRLLENEGVNPSTSEKLVGDRYPSEVGFKVYRAIERAHSKAKRIAS